MLLPSLYHSGAILFGAPDGPGPQNFSAFLHAPAIIGYLVGVAILTGVLFRAGAACIINLVIGAIFLVHISHGFDVGKGGFECACAQLLIGLVEKVEKSRAKTQAAHDIEVGSLAGSLFLA